jgi:hypothetical protein
VFLRHRGIRRNGRATGGSDRGRSNKLSEVEGLALRWIGEPDYRTIRDDTDYNLPAARWT